MHMLHTKFRMGSATYKPKTIPVALPEEHRRCVVIFGYIDRQTTTANTHRYFCIALCCQRNNCQKTTVRREGYYGIFLVAVGDG